MRRPAPFTVRRQVARVLLGAARWKVVGDPPRTRGILVGAPHTSNWDWVVTLLLSWHGRIRIRLLVKNSLFRGPLGALLRSTGAVELDRANPGPTIRALLEDAENDEEFLLGLAAEGTRTKSEYWKSGFYRISQQTGIPITLAFVDGPSRTVGWGPTFEVSGDVVADMDKVRAFFADKRGFRPENITEPRLREERNGFTPQRE